MIIKDWKKYYTLEEAKELTSKELKEDAKEFAKKVIQKIKERKEKEKLELKEEFYV